LITEAIGGNVQAIREIGDRSEGKPARQSLLTWMLKTGAISQSSTT